MEQIKEKNLKAFDLQKAIIGIDNRKKNMKHF